MLERTKHPKRQRLHCTCIKSHWPREDLRISYVFCTKGIPKEMSNLKKTNPKGKWKCKILS